MECRQVVMREVRGRNDVRFVVTCSRNKVKICSSWRVVVTVVRILVVVAVVCDDINHKKERK